ncbi:MAG: hypothetical protein ACI9O6_003274 [Glaciecola sp.]|jgi:hypothetical protein
MKVFSVFSLLSVLLFSAIAESKLIIRGGASTDAGGGGPLLLLGPAGLPNLVSTGGQFEVVDPATGFKFIDQVTALENDTTVYPFENVITSSDNTGKCDPQTCEYSFDAGEQLNLQGYNINVGANLGVTTSYLWQLTSLNGNLIGAWLPTAVNEFSPASFDIFLDALFPANIEVGQYNIALITTYSAPQDQVFGLVNSEAIVEVNGQNFYLYNEVGDTFSVRSRDFNLFVNSSDVLSARNVDSPMTSVLMLMAIIGLLISRKHAQRFSYCEK